MLGNNGQDEPFYYSQAHCEADILRAFWSDPPYARKQKSPRTSRSALRAFRPWRSKCAITGVLERSTLASKNNQQGTDLCACAKKSTIALIFGDRAMIV